MPALAYLWMVYLGMTALYQGWYKQFHRSDRVDLSLFQLGVRLLEHMLNLDWAIRVVFVPPPLNPLQNVRLQDPRLLLGESQALGVGFLLVDEGDSHKS